MINIVNHFFKKKLKSHILLHISRFWQGLIHKDTTTFPQLLPANR